MTKEEDHPKLKGYPIDTDYIDVETRRADVSLASHDPDDDTDFSEVENVPADDMSGEATDMSYRYGILDGHGMGGTAWDHEIDENAPQEHDGRARTRTGFDPREANDSHLFRRLALWQDGMWANERSTRNNMADKKRWVSGFSSQLELTPYQQERVLYVAEDVDMSHMAHYKTEVVVLAIISLVANEDGRWIRDEKEFKQLVKSVGASARDVRSCRLLVRRKSKKLGY